MSSESQVAAPFARRLQRAMMRVRRDLADRYRAEAKVHRKIRRTFQRRIVPRVPVAIDALFEIGEERSASRHTGLDGKLPEIRPFEAQRFERWHVTSELAGRHRQRAEAIVDRMRTEVRRRQSGEPRLLVRCEYAEGFSGLRKHVVALEDHLVLRQPERNAATGQRSGDCRIARARRRLVVAIRVHGVGAEFHRERWDGVAGERMADDQSASARSQRAVELDQTFPNEFHTPVGRRRQRVENFAIEDERAEHLLRIVKRVRERGVVEIAEVAAEPDERPAASAAGHWSTFVLRTAVFALGAAFGLAGAPSCCALRSRPRDGPSGSL